MSVSNMASLRHPPEVVVSFVNRLMDDHHPHDKPERRARPREPIAIPVSAQPLDANFRPTGDVFAAVTKDISTGGIGVIHSEQIVARYLQIEIATQDGEEMSLLAQVKHCTPYGPHYHIGARFVVDWSLWRDKKAQNNSSGGLVSDDPANVRSTQDRR